MTNESLQQELKKQKQLSKTITILIFCLLTSFVGFLLGLKIGTPDQNYAHVLKVLNILEEEWYSEIYYPNQEDAPVAQFISSVANLDTQKQLDPYTYLIKRQPSVVDTSGKLGIKIQNCFNANFQLVKTVYPNTPAEKAGLKPYDLIYGVELEDGSLIDNNYTAYLSGTIGESITLCVYRFQQNEWTELKLPITYDKVTYPTAYCYTQTDDNLLYVKLDGFVSDIIGSNTVDELDAILKENTDKDYLIIDLINNGGGALDSVVAICDLFLPSKQLVATIETKNKDQTKYQTKDKDAYTYDHIFLLMNENTASASEILIGCLGYHLPNLTIIGTNTYGKGIAQRTINITSDYDFQYTFAKWFTPDNQWIHTKGFAPSTTLDAISKSEDYLLYTSTWLDAGITLQFDQVDTKNIKAMQILMNQVLDLETNLREDGYFDNATQQAVLDFQKEHQIEETGVINNQTLLYFALEYANVVYTFDSQYLNRVLEIISG